MHQTTDRQCQDFQCVVKCCGQVVVVAKGRLSVVRSRSFILRIQITVMSFGFEEQRTSGHLHDTEDSPTLRVTQEANSQPRYSTKVLLNQDGSTIDARRTKISGHFGAGVVFHRRMGIFST